LNYRMLWSHFALELIVHCSMETYNKLPVIRGHALYYIQEVAALTNQSFKSLNRHLQCDSRVSIYLNSFAKYGLGL
jgi:hypothetical protein